MLTTLTWTGHFESGHWLPKVPEGHRCRRRHGHNYRLQVEVRGTLDHRGFVMDFGELEAIVNPIIARVDHYTLNDIEGLENPTAEVIAEWFWKQIKEKIGTAITLVGVRVFETNNYSAYYTEA